MKEILVLIMVWLYIGIVKSFVTYCRVKNQENDK